MKPKRFCKESDYLLFFIRFILMNSNAIISSTSKNIQNFQSEGLKIKQMVKPSKVIIVGA